MRPFSRFSRRGHDKLRIEGSSQAADGRIFILTLSSPKGKDPLFAGHHRATGGLHGEAKGTGVV